MSIVFLNGKLVDEEDARVSINDSGYYYGDGVYEVIMLYNGKLIDENAHVNRLIISLQKTYFLNYPSKGEILKNIHDVIKSNKDITTGSIYIQFTRGCCERTHTFLNLNLIPNCLIRLNSCTIAKDIKEWKCTLIEDPRRSRCDVKMTSLMPMVIAKYESERDGFDDVLFYNSKCQSVTEGSSYNIFIVTNDDTIVTCPDDGNWILSGCTRARIIEFIRGDNIMINERFFSKEELYSAKEVFTTSSIKIMTSITMIDGEQIGNGKVGKITQNLRNKYLSFLESYNYE